MNFFWSKKKQNPDRDLDSAIGALRDGHALNLIGDKRIVATLNGFRRVHRPKGLKTVEYSYESVIRAGGFFGYGYGESNDREMAVTKSVSEAFERVVFKNCRGLKDCSWNSNGWASHYSLERAKQAAFRELLERDGILSHWLSEMPFTELDPGSFPEWLNQWIRCELLNRPYSHVRVLVSQEAHLGTVSVLLLKPDGKGVISHSSGTDLDDCIRHALTECCRIAHILEIRGSVSETAQSLANTSTTHSSTPEDHAQVFSDLREFPAWMFGLKQTWHQLTETFHTDSKQLKKLQKYVRFEIAADSPLYVVRCRSEHLQNLFFGSTRQAMSRNEINWNRLKQLNPTIQQINLQPHPVA